jgi:hypothetical protein
VPHLQRQLIGLELNSAGLRSSLCVLCALCDFMVAASSFISNAEASSIFQSKWMYIDRPVGEIKEMYLITQFKSINFNQFLNKISP